MNTELHHAEEIDTSEVARLDRRLLLHSLRGFSIKHEQPSQSERGPGQGAPAGPGSQQGTPALRRGPACCRVDAGGRLRRGEDHREVPPDAPRAPAGDVDLQDQGARE